MTRIKTLGLALVAVFAMAAIASASASAANPAFYECKKVAGGKYEKGCGKEGGTGGFEIAEGIGKKHTFKGKGATATLHTPAVGGEVTCKSFKDVGENTSTKTQGKIVSTFGGCVSLGKKCTSVNPTELKVGFIKTKALKGRLGYINASKHEVGVLLESEQANGVSAEFGCEGLEIVTTGSVIGKITEGINTFSKNSTDTFAVNAEGFQTIKNFEGEAETHVLESLINGGGPFESGQQASAKNVGELLDLKA